MLPELDQAVHHFIREGWVSVQLPDHVPGEEPQEDDDKDDNESVASSTMSSHQGRDASKTKPGPEGLHKFIFNQAKALLGEDETYNPGNNILPLIPALKHVVKHEKVDALITRLLGPGYMLHPHRHCHPSSPGRAAQTWHRDSYFGFNHLRRYHEPFWVMLMYYPQNTTLDIGPTGIIPKSQYLTKAKGDKERHFKDIPPHWALDGLNFECPAGSCVIIHYDLWHRGTANVSNKSGDASLRYMFKFQYVRVALPVLKPLSESPFFLNESDDVDGKDDLLWSEQLSEILNKLPIEEKEAISSLAKQVIQDCVSLKIVPGPGFAEMLRSKAILKQKFLADGWKKVAGSLQAEILSHCKTSKEITAKIKTNEKIFKDRISSLFNQFVKSLYDLICLRSELQLVLDEMDKFVWNWLEGNQFACDLEFKHDAAKIQSVVDQFRSVSSEIKVLKLAFNLLYYGKQGIDQLVEILLWSTRDIGLASRAAMYSLSHLSLCPNAAEYATSILLEKASKDSNITLIANLLASLGITSSQVLNFFESIIKVPFARQDIAEALGLLLARSPKGSEFESAALQLLSGLLEDGKDSVRMQAMLAVCRAKDSNSLKLIVQKLANEESKNRYARGYAVYQTVQWMKQAMPEFEETIDELYTMRWCDMTSNESQF
jgi:hypothetical protein